VHKSFMTETFIGMALLGEMLGPTADRAGDAMVAILTDRNQREIMAMCFYQSHRRVPNEGEDFMVDPVAVDAYERLKNFTRGVVQNIFDEAERQDRAEALQQQRQAMETLQIRLRTSNAPHPEGTVAELAARFNVSKSEIRRRKADGTLNELLGK
jgi:hypothetical protein